MTTSVRFIFSYDFKMGFLRHQSGMFSKKIYIVVTGVNDMMYSLKSFNTLVGHNTFYYLKTMTSYEPRREKTGFLPRRKQRRRSASQ